MSEQLCLMCRLHPSRRPYCKDCRIAKLEAERDRLREIVEMAWKGWGYDQEWACDCPVCAAIRTRTPHALEGGDDE